VTDRQVAVVTGGGGGIGAAVAAELGRAGWFVVTIDPLVTVDGAERMADQTETTADRIVAAGGAARASSASVTDGPAVASVFGDVVAEHGRLDAVVNVAGISRPTGYGRGSEEDWRAVLDVHLNGYLNVLAAALPIMAAAGRGTIVGVTSGSGWRAADAGAYSRAKRAVAALTWQLSRQAPAGVTINAMSPIAATRMVLGALSRAPAATGTPSPQATGGLSLASMPPPEELGPFGAHMASERFAWCNGRVLFAAGSEVAVIDEPRLLEVVSTGTAAPLGPLLGDVISRAFGPAEAGQAYQGGSNARFGDAFAAGPATAAEPGPVRACAVVTDGATSIEAVVAALEQRSIACHRLDHTAGFDAASRALGRLEGIDAVVVALGGGPPAATGEPWERILDEHRGLVDAIHADSTWSRAAADTAKASDRALRLVTLTDATTAGGTSRAQSSAQAARVAGGSTKGGVTAFSVSVEGGGGDATGELVAQLLTHPEAGGLAGAELAVGDGWIGLRSHPRPLGGVAYGGPAIPTWLDTALREITGRSSEEAT
jgi:NAD(P)-dependent dehydrogenase (short-subunit alcohol dehydrogenase family)